MKDLPDLPYNKISLPKTNPLKSAYGNHHIVSVRSI